MQIKDSANKFGMISLLFHWVTAGLIVLLFLIGEIMDEVSPGGTQDVLVWLHQSFGMLFLFIVSLRLIWRLSQGFPEPADPGARRLNQISRLWHWALMALIIALPISGYLTSETSHQDIAFFGLFSFPDLLAPSRGLNDFFEDIHEGTISILIPMVIIHALAALKHHFWDRDATLKNMLRIE